MSSSGPLARSRSPAGLRYRGASRLLAVALTAGLLAGLQGCAEDSPEASGDLSVLVVTLDTTRADHVGAYGCPVDITPTVDGLAARGVVFENAYAPMPQTLPSHSTLFTGLPPREHGAVENSYTLAPAFRTTAETFAERGYATGAFIGALAVARDTGIDQGFEVFDQPEGEWGNDKKGHPPERPAHEVTGAALAWAEGLDADRPFFAWAHYYDPHGPFEPPEEDFRAVPRREIADWVARRQASGELPPARALKRVFPDESGLVAFWRAYAAEIRATDAQVGRLLDGLRDLGLMENTIVLVVGDHGEGLYEHGEKAHGTHIWEEMMRVPMVLAHPHGELAGRRVAYPTTLVDVQPTLEAMALGRTPARAPDLGVDLWSLAAAEGDPAPRPIFLERPHFDEERARWRLGGRPEGKGFGFLSAVVMDGYKLIREPDGEEFLFHLEGDGAELRVHDDPALRQRLAGMLDDWSGRLDAGAAPGVAPALSPERLEALQALGYIGGDEGGAPDGD